MFSLGLQAAENRSRAEQHHRQVVVLDTGSWRLRLVRATARR